MGKQVNFYMTVQDERSFLKKIEEIGPYKLLRNCSEETVNLYLANLGAATAADAYCFLCPAAMDARISINHIKEQSVYCVDFLDSEVVEFSRSRSEGHRLYSGRLWFDERGSNGKKRVSFCIWAKAVLAIVKKNYYCDGAHYLGRDALERVNAGELELSGPGL